MKSVRAGTHNYAEYELGVLMLVMMMSDEEKKKKKRRETNSEEDCGGRVKAPAIGDRETLAMPCSFKGMLLLIWGSARISRQESVAKHGSGMDEVCRKLRFLKESEFVASFPFAWEPAVCSRMCARLHGS